MSALKLRPDASHPFIDQDIDLLKMDIEGAEQRVLQELAAAGKLRPLAPTAYLRRFGFWKSMVSGIKFGLACPN